MRLGQLSRKISVRSNEIVAFLSKKGIEVEDSTNSRIDDAYVKLVFAHFAPQLLSASQPENEGHQKSAEESPDLLVGNEVWPGGVKDAPIQISSDTIAQPGLENRPELENPENEQINEVNGVIKAPRIELQGLKVLGKIELPEPRKKEEESKKETEEPVEPQANTRAARGTRGQPKPNRQSQERRRKNPVATERERRAKQEEDQRKRQAELEKERKTNHYRKRVKPKAPTKALRIHNEEVITVEEDVQHRPKSIWGRIVRWLTSY